MAPEAVEFGALILFRVKIKNLTEFKRKSKMRGGKRIGAGRKRGTKDSKPRLSAARKVALAAAEAGLVPLDYMLEIMRDPNADPNERLKAAIAAAPYIHPRLSAVAVADVPNAARQAFERIERVIVKSVDGGDRLVNAAAVAGSDKLN
jgi:hypothetical protein